MSELRPYPTELVIREWEEISKHRCDMIAKKDARIAELEANLKVVVEALAGYDCRCRYRPFERCEKCEVLALPGVVALTEGK